jgi:hypothetical protein
LIVLFAGIWYVGVANQSPVHPAAMSILSLEDPEDLDCQPDPGPDSVLDQPGPSRDAGLSLKGQFICHRRVFSANERDPYLNFALRTQAQQAKRVAVSLRHQLRDDQSGPITIRIVGVDEEDLRAKIAAIYRTELLSELGPSRVTRGFSPDEESLPELRIDVRRVDVADKMTRARLKVRAANGDVQWLEI